MRITVVIPTRNRSRTLRENLSRIASLDGVEEVVVVDDASVDNTLEVVEEFRERKGRTVDLTYYRNEKRMRATFCWNLGLKAARGDVLVTLNDDTLIEGEDTIRAIRRRFVEYPHVGIVGARVVEVDRRSLDPPFYLSYIGDVLSSISGFVFLDQHEKTRYADFVSGVMAIRGKILDHATFDENYDGTSYREESDFQLSVRRAGWRILYEPRALVVHKDPKIGGYRGYALMERMYWKARNHAYFLLKHFRGLRLFWYLLCGFFILSTYRPQSILEIVRGYKYSFGKVRVIDRR